MIGGLVLALSSAALINIGFLLQHRGLQRTSGGSILAQLRRALRDRVWLSGQVIGWIGFAAQIVAVAIAPLALVQAFAAGGLALSVPVAAWLFRHHISRPQVLAVLVMAAALAILPVGFSTARDHLNGGSLTLATVVGIAAALALSRVPTAWARAISAGVFYGLADAAIKAVSLGWHSHGMGAIVSGWTVVAGVGTFAGFLAFQSSLREDRPVASISLMNGLAALVALVCGLVAFGETLGLSPAAAAAHLVAIGVVLAGVPVLAAAQAEIADSGDGRRRQSSPARPYQVAQRVR
jgi:hypothetical protein